MLNLQNDRQLSENGAHFIVHVFSYKLHSHSIAYCSILLSLCCQTFCSWLASYTTYVNVSSSQHSRFQFVVSSNRTRCNVQTPTGHTTFRVKHTLPLSPSPSLSYSLSTTLHSNYSLRIINHTRTSAQEMSWCTMPIRPPPKFRSFH